MKNVSASVRQRLLNLAKDKNQPFDLVLNRYAIERLLYRISQTRYKDQFLLKGGNLFVLWYANPHRPTRDVDLLAYGPSDIKTLESAFRTISEVVCDDGLEFEASSVQGSEIRKEANYNGVRIKLLSTLSGARIPLQIDVAFGDAVFPAAQNNTFPVLLDMPAPNIRTYPIYSVIAEKFHAIVTLQMENSRLKDFFDLWTIFKASDLEGDKLVRAISETFNRRRTPIKHEMPVAFTDVFKKSDAKQKNWSAFLNKNRLALQEMSKVIDFLSSALWPVYSSAARGESFGKRWVPDSGWV